MILYRAKHIMYAQCIIMGRINWNYIIVTGNMKLHLPCMNSIYHRIREHIYTAIHQI